MGRYHEIRLSEPWGRSIYQAGIPYAGNDRGFRGLGRDYWEILLILGWFTRPAAIAFIIEMIVAMLSTKIGVYFGNSPLGQPPAMPKVGLGAVLHDIRSDYAQIATSPLSALRRSRTSLTGCQDVQRIIVIALADCYRRCYVAYFGG